MAQYTNKSERELRYASGTKRIRTEAQIILTDLLNEALSTYTEEFNRAYDDGGLPQVTFSPDEVKGLMLAAAQRQLTPVVDTEATEEEVLPYA